MNDTDDAPSHRTDRNGPAKGRLSLSARIALGALAAILALPLSPATTPAAAKRQPRTTTRTFANDSTITIRNDAVDLTVPASPYPSRIVVDTMKGTIRDVNLTLTGLVHTGPSDIQVLLVGPEGQTAVVMADVGRFTPVDGVTLRLDDEATMSLPATAAAELQSGAFRPTNASGGAIDFIASGPSAGANAALSVFDATSPNGSWRLYVQDTNGIYDNGAFTGGWELEITTKAKKRKH